MDLGGLHRLLKAHLRQDGGQALGQHGLAGAGRADEQQVVAPRGGNLQRPLHVFLPHDIPQVREGTVFLSRFPGRGGGEGPFPLQVGHQGVDVRDAVDRQAARQGGLGGVFRRDEQLLYPGLPGCQGHGQHAGHAPQRAGEGQLAQKRRVRRGNGQVAAGGQQPHENGQVVHGAGLFLPGGGQIHGDAADGELRSAVLHRRPDPFPGLPYGGVRQAHDVKGRQSAGEKALGPHLVSGDAGKAQRADRDHHEKPPPEDFVQKFQKSRNVKMTELAPGCPESTTNQTGREQNLQNVPKNTGCIWPIRRKDKFCAKNNKVPVYMEKMK